MSSRKEQKQRLKAEREQSEAEELRLAHRRNRIRLVAGVVAAAVVVVIVVIAVGQGGKSSDIKGVAAVAKQLKGIPQAKLTLGNPDAKVTITEFGDLQCPACKAFSDHQFAAVVDKLVRPGTGKLVFKNFTIVGPDSEPAALASLAAAKQDRYWQFIDLFYTNQGIENTGYVTDSFLEALAKAAEVPDIARWNKDRNSASLQEGLSAMKAEANRFGFSSTPSFQISGSGGKTAVPAAPTASAIEQAVNQVR